MCFSGPSPAFVKKKTRKTKGRPYYLSFLGANCDNTNLVSYPSDCQLDVKGWRKDLTKIGLSEIL